MGDRGGGDRGGDRGGFRGGFGGRGDRGRGRGRGRGAGDKEEWVPCTKIGRLVKAGKIKTLVCLCLYMRCATSLPSSGFPFEARISFGLCVR